MMYPAIGCDPAYQSLPDCVLSQPTRAKEILFGGHCVGEGCHDRVQQLLRFVRSLGV